MRINQTLYRTAIARRAVVPPSRPVVIIALTSLLALAAACDSKPTNNTAAKNAPPLAAPPAATPAQAPAPAPGEPETQTMEVNKAVMVTEDLEFGKAVPTIAQGLQQIERRYRPDDGIGRTFAVLDAYGEATADGKLHISMHVSSEKPGIGELVFKPTGRVFWRARILPSSEGGKPKNLTIMIDDGTGKTMLVDGSNNPPSVLDAKINGRPQLVKEAWPDGAEREVTFVYSACGCPVKAMVRRVGDRTARTKELPVLFPDDPAAVDTISRLMRWQ